MTLVAVTPRIPVRHWLTTRYLRDLQKTFDQWSDQIKAYRIEIHEDQVPDSLPLQASPYGYTYRKCRIEMWEVELRSNGWLLVPSDLKDFLKQHGVKTRHLYWVRLVDASPTRKERDGVQT